jgi:hypothetical protein
MGDEHTSKSKLTLLVLTDSSKPDPGREDTLYGGTGGLGTAANDEKMRRAA